MRLSGKLLIASCTLPCSFFADPSNPFILCTDARIEVLCGVGTALCQDLKEEKRHTAFVSQGLTVSEIRYTIPKRESLTN